MANPLKQLAGETAIYGLSTILARVINFMLLPLYTRVLTTSDYGVFTELMSYIAVLQVVLVLGLETGCFRYASREGVDKNSVFSNAFICTGLLCLLFLGTVVLFRGGISTALGYPGHGKMMAYTGLILALDCPMSIIFAKLRHEHKALKFALVKTAKILTEVGANLVFYLILPARFIANPGHWMTHFISSTPDFTYPIFAILTSCILCGVLLIPEIIKLHIKVDSKLTREMLVYSLPLMIAALPGIMNDLVDRILMRFANADPVNWRADLGVYQAGVKIAVIMQLFSQMFRYAAEPFFFQREKEDGSRTIYADVLNYFTAFCMLGFLMIMLFMDQIGLIVGRNFRDGLAIAPIMLMAYILTGMLFNVNMWYKLSGKTMYALWITLAGLAVSCAIDFSLMPIYSYHAAAWGHVASYLTMLVLTAALGRKYYPVPYNWGLLILVTASGIGFWYVSTLIPQMSLWPELLMNTAFVIAYIIVLFAIFAFHKRVKNDRKNRKPFNI